MTFSLNSATLVGRISDYGVKLTKEGTATCALELTEMGRDERAHRSFITVEIWGKAGAPAAMQMLPGSLVLVSGQVRPKKVKEQWTLVIAAREFELLDRTPEREYDTEPVG